MVGHSFNAQPQAPACSASRQPALVLFAVVLGWFPSNSFAQEVSFSRDIRPILSDRCFACHGPDANERSAELRLDQAEGEEGAYKTGYERAIIKPGDAEASELWYRITATDADLVMPPADSHKAKLTEEEQNKIRQWIESGAKYEGFWAFETPRVEELPSIKDADWGEAAIDRFVLARLEREDLRPTELADRRTLFRRLSLDLRGLPPSREELHRFLADESETAYEDWVDRFLGSSEYGEHMARYWLDLVRFADTNGMHKDFYRNFVAYRDWVIRAYNENLPYDEFLKYQLAGDLYATPSRDQLVASGFNRLHLIIDRGTALPEESFFKNVVDRVSAVGTVFMGLTVQCAQCHDHKYDPITQRDYYSLFAFFNNIDAAPETAGRPAAGLQPPFISLASTQQELELQELNRLVAEDEKAWKSLLTKLNELKAADENSGETKQQATLTSKAESKYKKSKAERDTFSRSLPRAMVMKERSEVRETFLRIRGQYDAPGEAVQRNAPAFLPAMKRSSERPATRMDLAHWLTSEENPLTARVQVNRLWQQFFGTGLVKTSEDLGAQGEVPSHPELLDYLAVSYRQSGWDTKALVKQIVLSRTYQQSSKARPALYQDDPENRLLARGARFRLDAEVIRDQILATSGLLSKKMYGPSVKPPQPAGLWKAVTMTGERFTPGKGSDIYRRSLYTFWKRAMPPPQMTILNAPSRDSCIARRERTNTPSQALVLLNESQYLFAARHLAHSVVESPFANSQMRIGFLFETILCRMPDATERDVLQQLIDDLLAKYKDNPELAEELCKGLATVPEAQVEIAAWTVLINALHNLDITKNRE